MPRLHGTLTLARIAARKRAKLLREWAAELIGSYCEGEVYDEAQRMLDEADRLEDNHG